MNLRRKLIETFFPEAKAVFKFLDGKKTLIGVIIAVSPQVFDAIGQIVSAAGGDAEAYAKVTGAVIALLGLVHKFIKDA